MFLKRGSSYCSREQLPGWLFPGQCYFTNARQVGSYGRGNKQKKKQQLAQFSTTKTDLGQGERAHLACGTSGLACDASIAILPSEKLMSPSTCSSLMEAITSTTIPTVCKPSVSQMVPSMALPSARSAPPCPDPNPEPEPASSPSRLTLQFPCAHSSATPARRHGPGAPGHPPTARSLPKSSLGDVGGGSDDEEENLTSGPRH